MTKLRHTRIRPATLLALGALALPATACGRDADASGSQEAASASFCADAVDLRQAFVDIFAARKAGDPQQLRAVVTAGREAATGMADRAPEAVDDAVGDLRDVLNRLDEELAKRDYDVTRLEADGVNPFEDDNFDEAGEDLEEYLLQECGVAPLEEDDDG